MNDSDLTQYIGIFAGVLTATSLLPQLVKLIRTKKSEDISVYFLIMLISGLALWVWYGIRRNDIPLIATNSVSLCINALTIILGVHYKKKHHHNNS